MKHCPKCNFSFPDFHRVCDFDGSELVPDPERPPLVNASLRSSRFRPALQSPVLWAGLLLIGVVSSAFLVAYYDAANQSTPVVKDQPSPTSRSVASASEQLPDVIRTPDPATRAGSRNLNTLPRSSASLRRQAANPRALARLHQRNPIGNRSRKSEIAARRNPEQISDKKEPKLVAILKTTWHVLKKPFTF